MVPNVTTAMIAVKTQIRFMLNSPSQGKQAIGNACPTAHVDKLAAPIRVANSPRFRGTRAGQNPRPVARGSQWECRAGRETRRDWKPRASARVRVAARRQLPALLHHRGFPFVGAVDHLPTGATERGHLQSATVDLQPHSQPISTTDTSQTAVIVSSPLAFVRRHASGRRLGSALFQNWRLGTSDMVRRGVKKLPRGAGQSRSSPP